MRVTRWTGFGAASLVLSSALTSFAMAMPAQDKSPQVSFNRDVRPILSDNCFLCHGFDPSTRKADLRLDTPEGLAADLDGFALITPGDPDDSELYLRISSSIPEDRMPHIDTGKVLSPAEIETIRVWIEEGAQWEGHWAYQAPKRHDLPTVSQSDWPRSPVDHFVMRGLDQREWRPAPDVDARTMIRRLYQDLTGLPPTPQEVAAFLSHAENQTGSTYDHAIQRAVDQLLASPHFAERMAVHWLDLVRYADTVGYHGDQDRSMSPYRDYVIQAFALNKGINEFIVEQLAGDLLPNPTQDQLIASGYNRLNQITAEGGAQAKEYIAIYAADRVRTTSTVFLGSTMGCAQCHDHKFDPITTKDFYAFGAFFADVEERGVFAGANNDGNWGASLAVPTDDETAAIQSVEQQQVKLQNKLTTTTPNIAVLQNEWEAELRAKLPAKPLEFAWIDDAQNNGGSIEGNWDFVGADQADVFSGDKVRRQNGKDIVQHFFKGATRNVRVGPGDRFYTHIWLDPASPPDTIMLQFFANNKWEHRAFWGQDKINFGGIGQDNGAHRYMGELPETAKWTRLEVDPATVGLKTGDVVSGIAFTQFGGLAYWDRSGLMAQNPLHSLEGLGIGIQQQVAKCAAERSVDEAEAIAAHFRSICPELEPTRQGLAATTTQLQKLRAAVATTLITRAVEPREIRVKRRGDWMDEGGEIVQPAMPSFLPQPITNKDRLNRLDLANWLIEERNPLTARVFVNRIWALFFGRGLVRTLGDFGSQGEWPQQMELLDWLALDFVAHDWDLKHLIRRIVTSRAYRQASVDDAEFRLRDPDNVLIGRQASFRLDAEFVRDQALAVSGLLNGMVGGKSVKPYQPAGYWRELNFPARKWQHDTTADGLRRGLYTYWCRTYLHPSLAAFDAVNREECAVERTRSNTPQQALALLNDPTYVEAARGLALRILREASASTSQRIRYAYLITLQREPRADEMQVMLEFMDQHQPLADADQEAAAALLNVGDHAPIGDLDPNLVLRWTACARVLLNLHEFITRY